MMLNGMCFVESVKHKKVAVSTGSCWPKKPLVITMKCLDVLLDEKDITNNYHNNHDNYDNCVNNDINCEKKKEFFHDLYVDLNADGNDGAGFEGRNINKRCRITGAMIVLPKSKSEKKHIVRFNDEIDENIDQIAENDTESEIESDIESEDDVDSADGLFFKVVPGMVLQLNNAQFLYEDVDDEKLNEEDLPRYVGVVRFPSQIQLLSRDRVDAQRFINTVQPYRKHLPLFQRALFKENEDEIERAALIVDRQPSIELDEVFCDEDMKNVNIPNKEVSQNIIKPKRLLLHFLTNLLDLNFFRVKFTNDIDTAIAIADIGVPIDPPCPPPPPPPYNFPPALSFISSLSSFASSLHQPTLKVDEKQEDEKHEEEEEEEQGKEKEEENFAVIIKEEEEEEDNMKKEETKEEMKEEEFFAYAPPPIEISKTTTTTRASSNVELIFMIFPLMISFFIINVIFFDGKF